MRAVCILILLLLSLLNFPGSICAQAVKKFDPLKDDIGSKIPPLSVLLDSAVANNHYVQFRNLQLTVNKCKLRTNQVEWTRTLGVQVYVGYGNLYDYSSNSTGPVVNPAVATNKSETQYRGSFYMNLPFFFLVDRKNQIKLAATEIEQAQKMAEVQADETRQLVIRQYNDVILKQRLLKIKSLYLETARLSMETVEKEFADGVTAVSEYSRLTQIFYAAESDYENANSDLLTAYMILEELVGMKFRLTNQISKPNVGN